MYIGKRIYQRKTAQGACATHTPKRSSGNIKKRIEGIRIPIAQILDTMALESLSKEETLAMRKRLIG